jgi:hypothetical protein
MATVKGGDKFEKALKEIAAQLTKPGTLKVGFLEGATYPTSVAPKALRATYAKRRAKGNAKPVKGSKGGLTVATVAAFNEYGTRKAPPRPFFRNMIDKNAPTWGPELAKILKANNYDVKLSLRLLGEGMAGQLKQSIIDTNSPPLAPSTIARKKFSKPLIDTSHMINSVDYQVE